MDDFTLFCISIGFAWLNGAMAGRKARLGQWTWAGVYAVTAVIAAAQAAVYLAFTKVGAA